MNKEQTIQHYMKKLGIDHDEAEQMYNDYVNALQVVTLCNLTIFILQEETK